MRQLCRKAKKRLIDTIATTASKVCNFEPRDNLLLCCEPRGGSTWIAEILREIPKTTVLWEPLHIRHMACFNKLCFAQKQYIPEQETWKEAETTFEQLFKGKILNNWTCTLSSPIDFITADQMIIKFCRANALLPWLTRVFDFIYEPLYLIRHPFAVVASQLSHGSWSKNFSTFNIPDSPYNDLYIQHSDFLSSLKTQEDALVATWCLSNIVPLHHPKNNEHWITVYYEDLISNPERGLHRIFDRWGLPFPESAKKRVRVPSITAKGATFQGNIEKQLSKWKIFFNQEQIEKMAAVLHYFEIKHYTTDIFPSKKSA